MKSGILYGMCWEDPDIFTALVNEHDRVLTVCSAGDIALSVLTKKPAYVVALDTNSDQVELTRARVWAYKQLNYQDCHRFIGSFGSDLNRAELVQGLIPTMNAEMKHWLLANKLDKKPMIQSGKFETYLRFFARFIFPIALSKATIDAF